MGEALDARADLYGAGAVLFECLTGRVVFEAETVPALVMKHLEETPQDPRALNPDVPEALSAVVLKALAKRRADRFASAREMYRALDAVRVAVGAAA